MEPQSSPHIFFEWLKRRRRALDLTQDELAKRAGCSVGALRKIESGDRRPSKQLAGLLAKALELSDEDQQVFIQVARGELELGRLPQPTPKSLTPLSDLWNPQQTQPRESIDERTTPPAHRIPLQATPLIGRNFELAAMERIFNDPQCRLLTLTGVGGIGKTRLAIEYARRKLSLFPGGVFYIPLTPVNSPSEIVPTMADVLEFGFSGSTEPKEQLLKHIASHIQQEALFIFDNLEHLLVQAPTRDDEYSVVELVSEILQRLPNIKILGTSRERLNLHGEWTYELHGLSVPPTNFAGRLEGYDSIALFAKSAQRIKTDFQVTLEDQLSIVRICQLVEGVPLAIELAAAWVGMLSCQEIAQEIQSNMDFLTTSMRDMPERHRSIRATFDHSWNLLSDDERQTLCQLSVFHGGFDRNAAYQIAGASLPLLASLSTKSLVRRSDSGHYDLHEVIRQYALSHLSELPNNLETYARHCEYYLNMLQDRENSLKNASQQETIRQLTDEVDNIRAAWVWAINHKKFAQLGQAGRAFGWYYEITGLYREGIDQLELLVQALKAEPGDNQWPRVLGLALIHQALLYFRKGEFGRALELYETSIAILRPIGDQTLLADSLVFLGTVLYLQGEYQRSRSSLEEGLFFARQANERWFEAWAVYNIGHVDSVIGRYTQGYEQMLTGIAMWRELGDPQSIALGLNFLVPTLFNLGRFEEAKSYMHESIALCEQSKNRWGMGTAYRYLGLAYLGEGQFKEAQAHLLKSLEIFGNFSVGWDIARSLAYLGHAAMMAGNFPEASKNYRDALHLSVEPQAIPIALDALLGLGKLQAQTGRLENALLFCYYILHHPSSEEETKSRAEQLRASLEPELSPEQVKKARTSAQAKEFDWIIKKAFETSSG
jgi:predicted ATPase/transcriptional regulator with XRE-family HTH domain